MDRAFAAAAVTTALHLLISTTLNGAAAVARPMGRQQAAAATSPLALAPAGGSGAPLRAAAAAREGKWLPFAGAHRLPAAYWAHKPLPWSPSLGGAVEGGEGEEFVRERERPSYGGDDASTTRQEQLAMWASLLNPKGKGKATRGWLPSPGFGEAADDEPGRAAYGATEGEVVDDQVGQSYWGNNGN